MIADDESDGGAAGELLLLEVNHNSRQHINFLLTIPTLTAYIIFLD